MKQTQKETSSVKFDAYEVAIEMNRHLAKIVAKIRTKNASLATQIEKAGPSVPLNLREGRRRTGKDRMYSWRIAAGSADEIRACLDVADAWGYVTIDEIQATIALVDRILAMTWRMTH